MTDRTNWSRPILVVGALLCLGPTGLRADPVLPVPGVYTLDNHPGGGEGPPSYGLRLDDLLSPGVHTFSFSAADGASVAMLVTDVSTGLVRISGTVFGGEDVGANWTDPSFFLVDFTYLGWTPAPGDDDLLVPVGALGFGSITPLDAQGNPAGAPISLDVFDDGIQGSLFRLGDQDDDQGYRDFAGVSGWGALTHGGGPHVFSSEWLFSVAVPTPEPGSLLLLGSGLLAGASAFRRRFF